MSSIFDTSALINLFNAKVLCLALATVEEPLIGEQVLKECDREIRQHLAQKTGSWATIDDSRISASNFIFLTAERNLGAGEAECIAYGIEDESARVICDDRKARNVTSLTLGEDRLSGSIGILSEMVGKAVLSPSEAFIAYENMVVSGGFLPELPPNFFET